MLTKFSCKVGIGLGAAAFFSIISVASKKATLYTLVEKEEIHSSGFLG